MALQLRTGDIILVDTEGIIPSSIDYFQGNDYNHAGFIVWIHDICYVLEAVKKGVVLTNIEEYNKRLGNEDINLLVLRNHKDFYNKYISEKEVCDFIFPLLGIPYGYCNLLLFQMIYRVTKKLGKGVWIGKNKEKSTKKFICGKLVMYIENSFRKLYKDNWWYGAPVDLFNYHGYKHIEYKN